MLKKYLFFGLVVVGAGISSFTLADSGSQAVDTIDGEDILETLMTDKFIPASYPYMNVLYRGVSTGTSAYETLQKAITIGLIPNKNRNINLTKNLTSISATRLIKTLFQKKISIVASGTLSRADLPGLISNLSDKTKTFLPSVQTPSIELGDMFQDAYTKLRYTHINSDTITDTQLIQGAIKGMSDSLQDPYTAYFPPSESKDFSDTLQGEFFGIGIHIEMKNGNKLTVVSPLDGSPGDLAGIIAGDQITKIDNISVDGLTLSDAVSKIKGPENTTVTLTILRNSQEIIKVITRKKIIIKPLVLKEISSDKTLISISIFQFGLDSLFDDAVKTIIDKKYSTIIIDLRNNPGGSLEDVEHMLDYFVPKGEPAVIVKSNSTETPYFSLGTSMGSSLQDKKIIVLINKGSASAAEIMAGVIKEYGSNTTLVGEKTFGKGSVQSLRDYADGSTMKITVAKRLMGKSKTSIDKIGVRPDKEIIDDPKTSQDEILDYAKSL